MSGIHSAVESEESSTANISELVALQRRLDRNVHGHILQALELQSLNDLATFVTTIGGVVAMTLSAAFLGNSISTKWAAISLALVSGVITLVGVLQSVWKPGERAQRHKIWSAKYASLENDCRLAACGLGSKPIESIMAEIALLSDEVDLVPERLWKRAPHGV